jgi:ElaB/YqjD/DUF883 family membrane-anchored ribosome-binding protein
MNMAQDRGGGGERDKTSEPFARAASDIKEQAAELADQVGNAAQDLYGQIRDSASQVADAAGRSGGFARKSASSFEAALRETIENSPYTAVAIGLGLGWLLGRMHRPL